ncbi:uncharacterized protein LOC125027304 isoform X2 [Penaeus chinensis]|uniref:uncharacterized protein LOC125027304 isoform X2 n=1 Tax=Penaeus chinensis TaxID=139456 RepID=UPI001FB73D8B|nr:uncharacterized protein LOC125027304 isoform X2 [Penaeus chinensis]
MRIFISITFLYHEIDSHAQPYTSIANILSMARMGVVSLGLALLLLQARRALSSGSPSPVGVTQQPEGPSQKPLDATSASNGSRPTGASHEPETEAWGVSARLSEEKAELADVILKVLTRNREEAPAIAPGQAGSRGAEGGSEAWCGVLLAGEAPPRKESAPEMAEILRGVAAAACHALQRLDGLKDRFMDATAPNLSWGDMNSDQGICEAHIADSPSADGLGLTEGLVQLYSLVQRRAVLMGDAALEQVPFTGRGFVCASGAFRADFSGMADDLEAVLDHLHAGVLAVGDGVDEAVTAELTRQVFGFPASSEGGCLLDFCALRGADDALRDAVDFALDNM